jgi:hypothetical protein
LVQQQRFPRHANVPERHEQPNPKSECSQIAKLIIGRRELGFESEPVWNYGHKSSDESNE